MKRWVAILAVCLGGVAAAPASAAPAPQSLSISVRGDGAQATRAEEYDPGAPIAVRVTNSGDEPLDSVEVTARGPLGESVRAPLGRDAGGTFTGSLSLPDSGSWRLILTSRTGSLTTDTTPVTLDVEAPPPSNAPVIGVAVGVAMFVVIGGGGFVLLRRGQRSEASGFVPSGLTPATIKAMFAGVNETSRRGDLR